MFSNVVVIGSRLCFRVSMVGPAPARRVADNRRPQLPGLFVDRVDHQPQAFPTRGNDLSLE
jgi:hypothetical protein